MEIEAIRINSRVKITSGKHEGVEGTVYAIFANGKIWVDLENKLRVDCMASSLKKIKTTIQHA